MTQIKSENPNRIVHIDMLGLRIENTNVELTPNHRHAYTYI